MMETTTHNPVTETAMIGDILSNRYRVLQIVNTGTITQVYLTEDISLLNDNICLLKRYQYNSKQANLFKLNKRLFELELEFLQLFNDYDKIPKLLDHFEDDHSLSLIEEFIDGELVGRFLPLSIKADNCWLELHILEFLQDTLDVLTYLNDQGFLHGNLKPNNIIQRKQDHHFCLLDFANVQKISDLENPFKKLLPFQTNNPVNPSEYLAPEQLTGQIKVNSDLYTLGLIAIQALTGIDITKLELSPQTKELNWLEIWQSHQKKLDCFVSEDLIPILNQLVCYDYKQRYQNAKEALQDVKKLIHKKTAQIIIFTEEQWPGLGFSPSYYFTEEIEKDLSLETALETQEINTISTDIDNLGNTEEVMTENSPSTEELLAILQENHQLEELKSPSKGLKIDQKWLAIIAGIGITGLLIYASVIYFGLGTILEVIGLDSSGKQLLKAQAVYEAGNIEEAMALVEAIPNDSKAYSESQTILKQWQSEWEKSNQQFKEIEANFQAKQWETVLQNAKKMPVNPLWQNKLQPLVRKAKASLDQEARQLLQKAVDYAEAQEFSQALIYLKQIPLESSFGDLVQKKLVEYEEKKEIRAYYNLQQAFNAAQKRDFLTALNFLKKIPPDSKHSKMSQQKIAEYTQMHNIKQIMQYRQGNYVPMNNLNPGNMLQEIQI